MGTIKTFNDLNAWKEGHKLVLTTYSVTSKFPKNETFALIDQMRRSSVSVTSNIAEGFSRRGIKEKIQFFSMSLGSLTELQNQLLVTRDVNYIDDETYNKLFQQSVIVHKLINGLIKGMKTRNP